MNPTQEQQFEAAIEAGLTQNNVIIGYRAGRLLTTQRNCLCVGPEIVVALSDGTFFKADLPPGKYLARIRLTDPPVPHHI